MKIIKAVAASIIDEDGRVLICKRPENKIYGGMWEFPGGKIKDEESRMEALIREVKEEVDIDICVDCALEISNSRQFIQELNINLEISFYLIRRFSGLAIGRESQEIKWVKIDQLKKYPMPNNNFNFVDELIKSFHL